MNVGRTAKINTFIIFFIVAAITFFSLAELVVPKDVAATEKQSCVTSKCHANMGKGKYVHGPVSVGQCTICHQPTDSHTFKKIPNVGQLCNNCHDKEFTGKVVHPPVKERKCTGCHDPHQSPNQFMLRSGGS
jgi:predicted CXXCH cytochrome family protein